MLHQRNHQQFSDCHAEKSEARNPKKGPEALFLCKVEQVLWQNDQILWMPELSRTNNPDCSVTPSRRCYEMLLCRPALWLFMWRDIFLSRSAIGYERIRFWFDLTRADVIQLESVPCEAMQGLFWCPCFFLFLCVCVWLELMWKMKENKWGRLSRSYDKPPQMYGRFFLAVCFLHLYLSLSSAVQRKWTGPTFHIFTAKKSNIWVIAANMKILHFILPMLQGAGKLHTCIK